MSRCLAIFLLLTLSFPLAANELHPGFPLLDASGRPVLLSGRPLSTMQTCGGCHDTAFIEASSDHADAGAAHSGERGAHAWAAGPGYFGNWDAMRYDQPLAADGSIDPKAWLQRYGGRHVGGGPVADYVEMDCLLCHTDLYGAEVRGRALSDGDYRWANSLPLTKRGILVERGGFREWNPFMFQADGSLNKGLLKIRKPDDGNCAQCHGQVGTGLDEPLTLNPDRSERSMTERTGQIFSPQKISGSGLNVAGKNDLNRPFDVHADRLLACVNCHYSLNNPVYFRQREESRPAHLVFDPRRLTLADYLQRPVHQFAKGRSTYGLAALESQDSLRRCESCHDADSVHAWLPYRERHFASLACESCHVPELYGPALQSVDWTLPDLDGQPRRQYRNVEGDPAAADSLIRGFRPAILDRANVGGGRKLAPFNLVASWYWVAGEPAAPVTRAELMRALYPGGRLDPKLAALLERNNDLRLDADEFRLDTPERAEAVRRHLEASGLSDVRLAGDITPFSINHNVVNGRWATRECGQCHGADSILAAAVPLSGYLPGGMLPAPLDLDFVALDGSIRVNEAGEVEFIADAREQGYYVLGLHQVGWVDSFGLMLFLAVLAGVAVHAMARYLARRGAPSGPPVAHERVYMYDAYDRLWHWLQASAILLLIATGLIIHKPHLFGMFSFAYVVRVHNVLGFIVLINAALALFYTLASGTIRRFLPQPKGFFGRAAAQAAFYSRGIFRGQPHPLQKTPENRLNPLQQVTYLLILNVLLPAQVITGVLIWGVQEWPDLAASLGGLPILAPIHTLVAWTFSAFIVMHVYLTTAAGETPGAGIRSMISGWEDVETPAGGKARSEPEFDHVQ